MSVTLWGAPAYRKMCACAPPISNSGDQPKTSGTEHFPNLSPMRARSSSRLTRWRSIRSIPSSGLVRTRPISRCRSWWDAIWWAGWYTVPRDFRPAKRSGAAASGTTEGKVLQQNWLLFRPRGCTGCLCR
ncbi:Uncharacterised protein [Mycobacteroides abscessus subsp. abscessus]|nr:Uncharacterised protein [Mycobacteroides abscessus subsp. abscessus]